MIVQSRNGRVLEQTSMVYTYACDLYDGDRFLTALILCVRLDGVPDWVEVWGRRYEAPFGVIRTLHNLGLDVDVQSDG